MDKVGGLEIENILICGEVGTPREARRTITRVLSERKRINDIGGFRRGIVVIPATHFRGIANYQYERGTRGHLVVYKWLLRSAIKRADLIYVVGWLDDVITDGLNYARRLGKDIRDYKESDFWCKNLENLFQDEPFSFEEELEHMEGRWT